MPWFAQCRRCAREVRVNKPSRFWNVAKYTWYVVTGILMALTPIIAAEATVLTPLAVMFLGAGGYVIDKSKEPPRCRRCLLALEPDSLSYRRPVEQG